MSHLHFGLKTNLFEAVRRNDIDYLLSIIERNILDSDDWFRTLSCIVLFRRYRMAQTILSKVSLNHKNNTSHNNTRSPLFYAIKQGDTKMISILVYFGIDYLMFYGDIIEFNKEESEDTNDEDIVIKKKLFYPEIPKKFPFKDEMGSKMLFNFYMTLPYCNGSINDTIFKKVSIHSKTSQEYFHRCIISNLQYMTATIFVYMNLSESQTYFSYKASKNLFKLLSNELKMFMCDIISRNIFLELLECKREEYQILSPCLPKTSIALSCSKSINDFVSLIATEELWYNSIVEDIKYIKYKLPSPELIDAIRKKHS